MASSGACALSAVLADRIPGCRSVASTVNWFTPARKAGASQESVLRVARGRLVCVAHLDEVLLDAAGGGDHHVHHAVLHQETHMLTHAG